MSDFYNNNSNNNSTESGEYSYGRGEINQGESYYQWTPCSDGKKPKKEKKPGGFGKKLAKAACIALVFGLVAGIAFQSVVLVSNKYFTSDVAAVASTDTKAEDRDNSSDNPCPLLHCPPALLIQYRLPLPAY